MIDSSGLWCSVTCSSPMAFDPGLAHVTDVAQVLPELVPAVGGDGMQQLLVHDDSFRLATAVRGVGWWGGDGASRRGRRPASRDVAAGRPGRGRCQAVAVIGADASPRSVPTATNIAILRSQ